MTDQFQFNDRDLKKLIKFYKEAPKLFQKVSAEVLSSMAFHDRKMYMRMLGAHMIIRNPALLKKGTRVEKAKQGHRIDAQFAISGSVETPRHDAWEHIEDGSTTRATQFMSIARGGSDAGRGAGAAKTGKAQTYESDFRLSGSGDIRILRYLQQIQQDKTRRRKTFFLSRQYKKMPPGIYKFVGGKVGKYKGKRTLVGAIPVRMSTPSQLPQSRFKPKALHPKEKATKRIDEALLKRFYVENMQRVMEAEAKKFK